MSAYLAFDLPGSPHVHVITQNKALSEIKSVPKTIANE